MNRQSEDQLRWLANIAGKVARILGKQKADLEKIRIQQIKTSQRSQVFKLHLEDQTVAVKVFPATEIDAFKRELTVLKYLTGKCLCPEVLGTSTVERLIVMEWMEGGALSTHLEELGADLTGYGLGAWLAAFTRLVPSKAIASDWYEYLQRYDEFTSRTDFDTNSNFLRSLPIKKTTFTKNDGYLANFLLSPGGDLRGIDFEAAVFKPMGWDVLLTARTLYIAFPEEKDAALHGLLRGWGQGTDCISATDFERLVRFFVHQTADLKP